MYLKRATLGLFASTMLCTSGAALAQPAQPAPAAQPTDEGDVIIVTAQKRTENLQNVPISIQALGTQQLEDLNVANFQDYTRLLPSISYQTFQPGTTNVYIRGVASGGDGNHSGSLPSVGVYLDEQPVTTIGGTSTSIFTTSPGSRCCAGLRARSTAPPPKRERSGSSPTGPTPLPSRPRSTPSSTRSATAASAARSKAMSTRRSATAPQSASSPGTSTIPAISTTSPEPAPSF